MTLQEAIEIKETELAAGGYEPESKEERAIKLLIEAGKRCLLIRSPGGVTTPILLPGETKEQCKYCGLAHTALDCPSREGEK